MRGKMPIAAEEFWAMAARCRGRAEEIVEPGLLDAYRQPALGYTRLAVQREAIDRCHTLIGRVAAAEKSVADTIPSVRTARPMPNRRLVEP
jgi:hypothetical protein